MFRKLGLLVAVCFTVAVTQAAAASETLTEPTAADLAVDAPAPAPGADAPKTEPDGMKPRPYAVELQKKLKKPGPPPTKPKYKPWDEIVTKDHKKIEGLLTFYTKGEEMLLQITEDELDKPMLAILSLSQGIGSELRLRRPADRRRDVRVPSRRGSHPDEPHDAKLPCRR